MKILFLLLLTALGARAALPDPSEYRKGLMRNPNLSKSSGEQFCWHSSIGIDHILTAYVATKDPRWLDEAVIYFTFLESKLKKDPDGYEGWIGDGIHDQSKNGAKPTFMTDALVGDAILLEHFIGFAEIVKNDPSLEAKYGAKAKAYTDLTKRIGWEKWNHRGCYYRDAVGYGSYHTHGLVIDRATGKWTTEGASMISDNLNKHSAMAIVLLRLYRVTGEEEYRTRAVEIFSRLKNMFRYFPEDDRVCWNFWMPHGPYDVNGSRLASWVGVHPSRAGYQATECARMVEAFDSGIVFDLADMRRLANTNKAMMPAKNGGKWLGSDLRSKAGTLWGSLARFDPVIKKELRGRLESDQKSGKRQIDLEYFNNITDRQDAESRTKLGKDGKVSVYDFPPRPGKNLSATVVIPNKIELVNGDLASLVTQSGTSSPLTIDLIDSKSGKSLGRVYESKGNAEGGVVIPRWDGTIPSTGKKTPGEYKLRWTFGNEVRDELISVVNGTKREKTERTRFTYGVAKGLEFPEKILSKGVSLSYDFSKNLPPEWILQRGAKITSTLPGGRKGAGLEIANKQTANLIFGNDEEGLPVRITMSVYDNGEKHGGSSVNGYGWGVFGSDGEFYGPVLFWRKYLGTDSSHSWISTEKSGWMSPQYARIPRKTGWREWVFDFTDPVSPVVILDGKKVQFPKNGLPAGASGISLRGGSGKAPLFVTDVRLEYP